MGLESYLDQVFAEGAKQTENDVKDKVFKYALYKQDFSKIIKKGSCRILAVNYDRSLDCNLFIFEDIDTKEVKTVNQFRLELKEQE